MRYLFAASALAFAITATHAQRDPHTGIFVTSDQCMAGYARRPVKTSRLAQAGARR